MKNSEACEFKENPSCQFNMSVMGDGGLDNLVSVPEVCLKPKEPYAWRMQTNHQSSSG